MTPAPFALGSSVLLTVLVLAPGARAADPGEIDLCRAVPGAAVAAVFGGRLKEARPFSPSERNWARCTYLVIPEGKDESAVQGYVVYLYPAPDYDALLAVTEAPKQAVGGLGDGAILFQDDDQRWKLRFVVRGRYCAEVTAADAAGARALARLVVAKL